jgi:hypothetical protein
MRGTDLGITWEYNAGGSQAGMSRQSTAASRSWTHGLLPHALLMDAEPVVSVTSALLDLGHLVRW